MRKNIKRYRLNRDFEIVCITSYINNKSKLYSIIVEMISLPFMYSLEKIQNISNPNKANNLFKEMCNKYKEEVNYYES